MFAFIIAFLVVAIPEPALLGTLSNHQVDVASYAYQVAVEYNIPPELFIKLVNCESTIDNSQRGDWSKEEKKYKAHGILQWWKSSWDRYSDKYNYSGNYWNEYNQIELAAIVISQEKNGWKNWYNCGKIAGYGKKM